MFTEITVMRSPLYNCYGEADALGRKIRQGLNWCSFNLEAGAGTMHKYGFVWKIVLFHSEAVSATASRRRTAAEY